MTSQSGGGLLASTGPEGRKIALYYPHIHFQSRHWLRATILYYDHISRIVPEGLDADLRPYYAEFLRNPDPLLDDIAALKANGFLLEDSPERFVSKVAAEFFDFAMDNLTDPQRRASLVPQLATRRAFYSIHPAKIDAELAKILVELKLAHKKEGDSYSDLDIEPVTGGLYMLFLASQMAGRRNLVSDSSVYQSLLYQPIVKPEKVGKGDREFRLATAVLRTAVPQYLESVPMDRLLQLRADLAQQRTRFQDKISALARDMEQLEDEQSIQEAIERHQRKIDDEHLELVDKIRSANLTFGTGLFAVSVPSWATAQWGMNIASMTPLLAGLGALAISGLVMKNIFDHRAARRTNPLSYLLSLREGLTPKSMAQNIITLNLSIADDDELPSRGGGGGGGRCLK
jgi:hypothetical protein